LSYRRIFHAQPGCYQITNGGLAVIDSPLPRPSIDLRCYQHDLGIVWLALATRAGKYGEVDRLLSEREMCSHDQRGGDGLLYGIPVGGYDRYGKPRVHYPDLLALGCQGERVALELELSVKGRQRLEGILAGYGAQPGLSEVVYVTDRRGVARRVREAITRLGLESLVRVDYRHGLTGLGVQAVIGEGSQADVMEVPR
jgi:hypothetical protein